MFNNRFTSTMHSYYIICNSLCDSRQYKFPKNAKKDVNTNNSKKNSRNPSNKNTAKMCKFLTGRWHACVFLLCSRKRKKKWETEEGMWKETKKEYSLRSHPTATGALTQVARRTNIKKPGVKKIANEGSWRDNSGLWYTGVIAINWSIPANED